MLVVKRLIIFADIVAITVILVVMNMTTPSEIGPLGVLVFFTMIYLLMLGLATAVMTILKKAGGKRKEMVRRDYVYASVMAFAPIMLLLVRSFGEMNVVVVGLVGVFVGLGCLLVNKWV